MTIKRNQDAADILRLLSFPTVPLPDTVVPNMRPDLPVLPNSAHVFQSHYLFFGGDLNYRLESETDLEGLIQKGQWQELLEHDQVPFTSQMQSCARLDRQCFHSSSGKCELLVFLTTSLKAR